MPVWMIGLSHKTAPVEIREALAFTAPGAVNAALPSLQSDLGPGAECVLLSTCNRTELYVAAPENVSPEHGAAALARAQNGRSNAGVFASATPVLEERRGHRAIEHLFRVASGLESMILGEPDIVRQVKDAYGAAADAGTVGGVLNPLFHRALFVAKRARTETQLGRGAFSVGHAAAEMAESIFGALAGRTVLVLGAGDMSEATARHLASAGASAVLVANRTFDRAARLAELLGGRAIPYERFGEYLERADIVIASTAAPRPIVEKPLVAGAMKARRHRPLFLIDIAVPRDIAADVADLDDVFLYNIDDLRSVVDADQAQRRQEAARAEALVRHEAVAFARWLRTTETAAPLVTSLRAKMDAVRANELARLRQRLPHLPENDWQAIEAATLAMVNKIAHAPTAKIKDYAADASDAAEAKIHTARELFALDAEPGAAGASPEAAVAASPEETP